MSLADRSLAGIASVSGNGNATQTYSRPQSGREGSASARPHHAPASPSAQRAPASSASANSSALGGSRVMSGAPAGGIPWGKRIWMRAAREGAVQT